MTLVITIIAHAKPLYDSHDLQLILTHLLWKDVLFWVTSKSFFVSLGTGSLHSVTKFSCFRSRKDKTM